VIASPSRLATAAVRELSPYVTGKPMSELSRELGIPVDDIVKLASNENPLGPSPLAVEAIRASLADLRLYPDGNGHELKQALARHHGIAMERITLGNGSNDLLVLLAEAFLGPQSNAVISQYAFAIYGLVVQATGASARIAPAFPEDAQRPFGHDLKAMLALVDAHTRLVFIANPNNPTGSWCSAEELESFLAAVPASTLVVLDEAYFEYARRFGCTDGSTLLDRFANLVVLRTFSKAHALAAVRVGYGLSHPDVANILNRVRQPFNVTIPGLVAAEAALADAGQAARAVALVEEGLGYLQATLPPLGVKVYPSAGNFVLADVASRGQSGQQVFESLLRHGVIVRPVGGYGLPRCVRITVGTAAQNARLAEALGRVLQDGAQS
jgi:histidinol-phosphate aminotransferase